MTTRLTPHTITEAIQFVIASNARALRKVMTELQDPCNANYQKYAVCRPALLRAYQTHYDMLQGQIFLMLDHHKIVEEIKAAQTTCQQEWRLYDFQIVTLQRPGTKPPFYIKEAA